MRACCNIHLDVMFSKDHVLDCCSKNLLGELYKCWHETGCHTGVDKDIASLYLHRVTALVWNTISLPGGVTML